MLENPGIRSEQIVWPGNAPDARDDHARDHGSGRGFGAALP